MTKKSEILSKERKVPDFGKQEETLKETKNPQFRINYIFGINDYFIMQPFGFNPGTLLPGSLAFRWFYQYFDTSNPTAQMTELMEQISPYFVTTSQVFLVIVLESVAFLTLIALVYKHQSC